MGRLGETWWGKSEIRVSKVDRGEPEHGFSDVTVQVLLGNDGESTHLVGDNAAVLPTDTMRNTVYGIAQEHLGPDLEGFATWIAERFVSREDVIRARVAVSEKRWQRLTDTGFLGGSSERRTARVSIGEGDDATWAGIEGLVVLKTAGSAFSGFPGTSTPSSPMQRTGCSPPRCLLSGATHPCRRTLPRPGRRLERRWSPAFSPRAHCLFSTRDG